MIKVEQPSKQHQIFVLERHGLTDSSELKKYKAQLLRVQVIYATLTFSPHCPLIISQGQS
jgi:hypothetical protein